MSRRTHCISLLLTMLLALGSASLAMAAAPVYEGTFTSPSLCSPRGVALSFSGDLFVGDDCLNPHMEHFTLAGGFLGTWGFPAGFMGPPDGVALDGSNELYVTDYDGNRILKVTSSGDLISNWGPFSGPVDLAVDPSGNVFELELGGKLVQKLTSSGAPLKRIGLFGTGTGTFQDPNGLGLDKNGRIYVADLSRMRILRFLPSGDFDMEFAVPFSPTDVAVGPDGHLYVIGPETAQVYEYLPTGVLVRTFGTPAGLQGAIRIVIDATGTILITEKGITKFQIDMSTTTVDATLGRLKAMYR